MESTEFQEGIEAYHRGDREELNPYPLDTGSGEDWLRGWRREQDRDDHASRVGI